jgi:CelD/BcsL family acetyltransferase involved in cellulose biosynthesis
MITVRLVETLDEFAALEPAFDKLLIESESPHPHLSFTWLYLWYKHFGAGQDLFLLVAEEGSGDRKDVVGIAPLMIYRERTVNGLVDYRTVRLIGHDFTDRNDFIVRARQREAIIEALADSLFARRARWDRLVLRHLNDASPTFKPLCRALGRKGCRVEMAALATCPWIDVEGSFDDYFKTRGRNLTGDVGRRWRRLRDAGIEPELQILSRLDEGLLDEIRVIDRARTEATAGRQSVFLDERKRGFVAELVERLNESGAWRIYVFRHQGVLLSYYICYDCAGTLHFWVTSYNIDYEQYSLGKVLLKSVVEDCFRQGFQHFDFMIGDEEYKRRWTDRMSINHVLTVTPNSLKNRGVRLFGSLVATVRKLKGRRQGG